MGVTVERVVVCTGVRTGIDAGGEMRNGEKRNEHIFDRFPIFFYICFFLSPFCTSMVFLKSNVHLILLVVGVLIVVGNVVVLEEVHDG